MLEAAAGTAAAGGAVLPEGVSFDGSSDRLRNVYGASGKYYTTMSFWFYAPGPANEEIYSRVMTNGSDNIRLNHSNGYFYAYFYNSNGGQQAAGTKAFAAAANTWNHIVFSGSFTSPGNLIQFYLNDQSQGTLSLTNDALANTEQEYLSYIGGAYGNVRLAHMYIKDGVIDLSVVANRRNFITADLKPAEGQGSYSNPRVYLPMLDVDTAVVNEGSNNNFTVNGTLGTVGRGPNQNNCVASEFAGSADYIRNAASPLPSTKTFTFAANITVQGNSGYLIFNGPYNGGSAGAFEIYYSGSDLRIRSATTYGGSVNGLITIPVSELPQNKNIALHISYDLTDTAKRHVLINNTPTTASWSTYTNTTTALQADTAIGWQYSSTYAWDGVVGEVYFDNTYIDLATDNPFWNSDTNRPNSVRKVIEDTSVTPLIALPIIGNDAGNNLGTSGDFTVNSGPYVGARGGSEFWARSAKFNGSTGYLSTSTALTGNSNSKKITIVFAVNPSSMTDGSIFGFDSYRQYLYRSTSGTGLGWTVTDSSGSNLLATTSYSIADYSGVGIWDIYLMSCDIGSSIARVYKNGVATGTFTFNPSGTPDYASKRIAIGSGEVPAPSDPINGSIGMFYFATDYIDFSQESNRLKFVDALGYPVDLTTQIEGGDIPTPLIHMKFEDTTSLGTNSGSGGDFTVNGTVTSGSDVEG